MRRERVQMGNHQSLSNGVSVAHYFLNEGEYLHFLENLRSKYRLIAPVEKKSHFLFEEIKKVEEIRLDYDVTILPPKKAIFPENQTLLTFSPEGVESGIENRNQVLFGVHYYDVKGIRMLDILFEEKHADNNYLQNRKNTIIIATNIQSQAPRAFHASAGGDLAENGHDAFFTKISGGFHIEILTEKGESLLDEAIFTTVTSEQQEEARRVRERDHLDCANTLPYSTEEIAEKTRKSFNDPELWNGLADRCFSCGSCNTTCPTCYCFDVQDEWNIDQKSGRRYRVWDGCLMEDFCKVSLGGGACERFRDHRSDRFRHRVMRKAAYLNKKFGSPACVGCGRCSINCVPDIADPLKIISTIMEA